MKERKKRKRVEDTGPQCRRNVWVGGRKQVKSLARTATISVWLKTFHIRTSNQTESLLPLKFAEIEVIPAFAMLYI